MNVENLVAVQGDNSRLHEVSEFIHQARYLALNGLPLFNTIADKGSSNFFSSALGGNRRSFAVKSEQFEVTKVLRHNFLLAVKHPNVFAALLPVLLQRFACCATVRNPLSVLASWETVDLPVHHGRAPYAEAIDANLRAILDSLPSAIDRQIALLDWYFQTFTSHLSDNCVIRYEDVIDSNGSSLSRLIPPAEKLPIILSCPLKNQNQSPIYDNGPHISQCADALLQKDDHACWKIYDRSEVIAVHEATKSRRRHR